MDEQFDRRAPVGRRRAAGAAGDSRGRATRSVLVLDRDSRNRARVKDLLQDEDYWVFATGDARAALRLAHVGATDLLLTDLGMPVFDVVPRWARRSSDSPVDRPPSESDGYAVLRTLQTGIASARYPIVVLRDEDARDESPPSRRFGIVGYAPKAASALLARLDTVFQDAVLAEDADTEDAPPLSGPGSGRPASAPGPGTETPSRLFEGLARPLRRALLVDADASCRTQVREALNRHGFTVDEASDGEEGLRLATARRPWLILTEVELPRLHGFELCRRVRSHSLLSHTPFAFLSSCDDYEARYQCLKLGADDHLSKPIQMRELLIRIALILRRYSDLQTRTRPEPGLSGDLVLVGTAGALQLCHLGRMSGFLTARCGTRVARIGFGAGEIVSAEAERLRGAEAVYEFLAWSEGQFEFLTRDPGEGPPLGESFDQLLLEGCRRLDEARLRVKTGPHPTET